MKFLVYSSDTGLEQEISSIESDNLLYTTEFEPIEQLIDECNETEEAVFILIDLECEQSEELVKFLVDNESPFYILSSMSLRDLKKHQTSNLAADGYLSKPIDIDKLSEVIADFKLIWGEEEEEDESEEDGSERDLTFSALNIENLQEELKNESNNSDEQLEDEVDHLRNEALAEEIAQEDTNNTPSFETLESTKEIQIDNDESEATAEKEVGVDLLDTLEMEEDLGDSADLAFDLEDTGSETKDETTASSSALEFDSTDNENTQELDQDSEVDFSLDTSLDSTDSALELSDDESINLDSNKRDEEISEIDISLDLGDDESLEMLVEDSNDEGSLESDFEAVFGTEQEQEQAQQDSSLELDIEGDDNNASIELEVEDQSNDLEIIEEDNPDDIKDDQEEPSLDLESEDQTGTEKTLQYEEGESPEIVAEVVDFGDIKEANEVSEADETEIDNEHNDNAPSFDSTPLPELAELEDEAEDELDFAESEDNEEETIVSEQEAGEEDRPYIDVDEPNPVSEGTLKFDVLPEMLKGDEKSPEAPKSEPPKDTTATATQTEGFNVQDESEDELEKPVNVSNISIKEEDVDYIRGDKVRFQGIIKELRKEREQLLKDIYENEKDKKVVEQENLGLRAELDELKIELSIFKKRHLEEVNEWKLEKGAYQEKKEMLEEKVKTYQREIEKLNARVRIDFNKIKQREKELESKLELMSIDSENQLVARDGKIIELKRKIDALEFNMENSSIVEQKAKDEKAQIEDRLQKIMKTLRQSIQLLEDDIEIHSAQLKSRQE